MLTPIAFWGEIKMDLQYSFRKTGKFLMAKVLVLPSGQFGYFSMWINRMARVTGHQPLLPAEIKNK
jgi:hypothetical protein